MVAATRGARDLVHALLNQARSTAFKRCIYCGMPSYGNACFAHKDLPQLEHALTKED